MNNKPDAYDMHCLSTFLPCGIDDVTEKDLADVGLLGLEGILTSLTLDNPAHELEPEKEDELEELDTSIEAEEKAHRQMQANRFNDISDALAKRLVGDDPWIDIPLVKEPKSIAHHSKKLQYTPKRIYKDWIERDGMNHWFHWRCTHNEVTATGGPSDLVWYRIWACHRSGKPKILKDPEDPDVNHREVYKDSRKIGCNAVLYVHKFKPLVPLIETKNASTLVRIT
ncbi:hypothetical protein BGX26_000382 [Mortierella sp. AD094]|nr:hypothetical protein BGX26_000382 [Mortierella sp. AD094]